MINNPDSNFQSESLSLNRTLLTKAWQIYEIYDHSAIKFQKRFIFLQLLILRLSVLVTFLAVLNSQINTYFPDTTLFVISCLSQKINLVNLLDTSVIIAPITVSVVLAGAVKFGRGVNWVLLRGSAETLKQEIYRYRTQIADYSDPKTRDTNFAQEIQTISERLMKTQVNQAGLSWDEWQKDKNSSLSKEVSEDKEQNTDKDNELLSALTAEEYMNVRLIDQLTWYQRKTLELDRKWQWWQWWIYILGGIGTYLAAIGQDVWIAVTNSIAASVLSFLEFRRLNTTLIGYNQTATNLENILCWWQALTPKAKTELTNIEKLVESSEKVIRAETTGWVQEMRDALAGLYQEKEPEK